MEHHDHSLAQDIQTMLDMTLSRRQSLRWMFASAASLPLAACGGGGNAGDSSAAATPATGSTPASGAGMSCAVIPEETGGPYPADGTNSSVGGVANALILAGIVRPDIRASIAGATGVAAGVPLTIKLQMVNVKSDCAPLAGATVYLWHCDREGRYSMYTSGVTLENYLRGVQEADAGGMVTFTTIFPGCYAGRMPHVHFEVYPSLAKSTSAANRIKTSQFGFPASMLAEAYGASGYSASVRNLANITYATDNVFSDGSALQIASVSGSASLGYVATLTVGVSL
ncbi:intradiol ring-cleavage dioxygenase [Massilia violaceinigra]|uniref:Intradiol ring-cleavage dioxygenase n=1 Tax=Massilia violaceinigra TaxID=2045208 RepID=A0ABY4A2P5_9BURK|nr:intradiol ring-cleavage dioxygenase [Massilia violaceinigra]UOD28948.1 intradiol ring-cleavage dioxygenase [Massilia violaceinigra]